MHQTHGLVNDNNFGSTVIFCWLMEVSLAVLKLLQNTREECRLLMGPMREGTKAVILPTSPTELMKFDALNWPFQQTGVEWPGCTCLGQLGPKTSRLSQYSLLEVNSEGKPTSWTYFLED